MNHNDFNQLVIDRLEKCADVLRAKDREYSSEIDRLHNFVVAGRIDNESPEKALWGMLKKHIVSVRDIVEQMEEDRNYIPSKELISEKFGDVINYHLLLEGLIEDRRRKKNKEDFNEFEEEKSLDYLNKDKKKKKKKE